MFECAANSAGGWGIPSPCLFELRQGDSVAAVRGVAMRTHPVIPVLVVLLAFGLAEHAAAAERLSFAPPLVSSDTQGLASTVSDIVDRASELIGRVYGQNLSVALPGDASPADFTAATIASQDKDTLALVISLKRLSDGATTPSMVWSAPASAETPLWLARSVFLLWSSFHGFLADQVTAPPVYADELPVTALNPLATPLGIAVTPSGTIAAALALTCVELDHTFRQVGEPGKTLTERSHPGLRRKRGHDPRRVVPHEAEHGPRPLPPAARSSGASAHADRA